MRRWMLVTLLFPVVAWLLYKLADRVEGNRGDSGLTHVMRAPHRWRKQRTHGLRRWAS